jgi:hypothetical protein
MNETPESNNRLRSAVKRDAVPADLAARIRSQIHTEQLQSAVNDRLKAAVNSVPVPPFLEARIMHGLRTESPTEKAGRRWLTRLIPAAAALAVCAGFGVAYQLGHLRLTVNSQESYIGSVSTHIATLMRVGLGDHIHCAVFRKYPKNPPTTEQFIAKMNPQYAGLIPIVRSQVPDNYRMMLAHQCSYHRRKFVHLSLMSDSNMLSLVITRKGDGESFSTEDMLPALVQAGIPMYQSSVQRFQMTAFETRDYLVYFISDLPKQQSTQMMLALGPKVKDFLVSEE